MYAQSIKCYEKAIEIDPNQANVWFNQGYCLRRLAVNIEDNDQKQRRFIGWAEDSFEKAIQIKPDYIAAWLLKGEVLGDLGQYRDALYCFERILEIDPHCEEAELALEYKQKIEQQFG